MKYRNQDGLCGFVDEARNWVIQPIFKDVDDFDDGKICAKSDNDKYGVMDKSGNWIR